MPKSVTQETRAFWNLFFLGMIINESRDTLEKGSVTRSSILAWRIPRTEELSGLESIRPQGLGRCWGHIEPNRMRMQCDTTQPRRPVPSFPLTSPSAVAHPNCSRSSARDAMMHTWATLRKEARDREASTRRRGTRWLFKAFPVHRVSLALQH